MVTKKMARLEAKLRGLNLTFRHYHAGGLIPRVSGWYEDGRCKCEPGGVPFVGQSSATDPATAEGAWAWVRLAKLHVFAPGYSVDETGAVITKWRVAQAVLLSESDDPIAAVSAAVEALVD